MANRKHIKFDITQIIWCICWDVDYVSTMTENELLLLWYFVVYFCYFGGKKATLTFTERDFLPLCSNENCNGFILLWWFTFTLIHTLWTDTEKLVLFPVLTSVLFCSSKKSVWMQLDDSPHCWAITQWDINHSWRREKAKRGVSAFPSLCCLTHSLVYEHVTSWVSEV